MSARLAWHRWAALAVLLCMGAPGCKPRSAIEESAGMTTPSRPIAEVLADHAPRLMAMDGVTAVGESALEDGTPCISVYLLRRDRDLERRIPARIEGYAVVVRVSGPIRALPERDP